MDRSLKRSLPLAFLALLSATLLLLAALASGCGGDDYTVDTTVPPSTTATTGGTGPSNTAPDDSTPATDDSPATTAANPSGTPVNFTTEDGIALGGHLYGSGNLGVVLSHMYPTDQTSWTVVAERLAQEGYLVLTYDFRGYGESGGSKDIAHIDRDVSAAVKYLRFAGGSDIVLVGASMGGTASLMASTTFQTMSSWRLAGVVTLSAPVEFEGLSATDSVPQLVVPLLFIAAEDDVGAEGARKLEELSGNKGDLQIVPGSDHGTDLFSGAQAGTVWQLLLDFLQQNLQVGNL
jgi:pimeloyl-ACP methyl ester carboxylesterase